jgi:hypothetical protein
MVIVEKWLDWRLAGETEILGEILPQRHFVHNKSHMTRPGFWTRATAVGSQRLTAWAMARPKWWSQFCVSSKVPAILDPCTQYLNSPKDNSVDPQCEISLKSVQKFQRFRWKINMILPLYTKSLDFIPRTTDVKYYTLTISVPKCLIYCLLEGNTNIWDERGSSFSCHHHRLLKITCYPFETAIVLVTPYFKSPWF